ncbi:DUF2958 domain-containing protein [Bradyrhizobium japonicum]|jgi:hypothetical protein|uniref:DUF2958 domain-containing protein n=1 Tax=Bradyrhizobium japonicum TaxID=375 RepID=UPI0020A18859|nr:DUF2958 domain-containing protein [Bradyrhizobium japonicum]MCP1761963.1 hypothetical protein [Bradyrhizobium japonicum]MCP1793543.1 hypothetical protein [Bradyrhizobium japonicum]MCP1805976.1 hypothetical protein [Bradyrhizobium japonicum]MCP1812379.1 hypothetical protein [Bradyrhizobium japonicum]MCP1873578.1 hypothetical protein [Bradyrhizobium japonicum]
MKIFIKKILDQLAANGAATRAAQNAGKREPDHVPVVKVFNPYGGATWLLTESDPDEPDRLYGLCDLGMGEPELGYVARSEIESVRVNIGGHGLPLERDMYFETDKPLSAFYEVARRVGRIEA